MAYSEYAVVKTMSGGATSCLANSIPLRSGMLMSRKMASTGSELIYSRAFVALGQAPFNSRKGTFLMYDSNCFSANGSSSIARQSIMMFLVFRI